MINGHMGPTYLHVQDGQPPVQPSFPISPTMQYAIGFVGSEIVKVLQNESQRNPPRNACYNVVAQNHYANQEFQFLYQLAAANVEYNALQQRQDPRNLVHLVVPEVVKAFTAYIWYKYFQQNPVPPDINGFLQTYIQVHNQHVGVLQQISHQTPVQNTPYGGFARPNTYPQTTYQQSPYPTSNTYIPPHQYQPSGNRFLSNPTPSTPQTTPNPIHNTGSRFQSSPMSTHESESRFAPKENWKGPGYQEYRFGGHEKQALYMESAMAKHTEQAVKTYDIKALSNDQAQTLFGTTLQETIDVSDSINPKYAEETLTTEGKYKGYVDAPPEWYPTESQRFWIIYNPLEYTCELRINSKGHPVQKFIQREDKMKEEDHIYADLDITGPKPSVEDLETVKKLERQFGLSEEQRESQRRKAIEDGRKTNDVPTISEEVETHDSLNSYFTSLQKKAIVKDSDFLTSYGQLSITTINKHSPEEWVKDLFECKSLSSVVALLSEIKAKEDIRSYTQMVSIYTQLTNDVLHDRMSLTVSFDDLVEDYQDLKDWLENEEMYDTFLRETSLALRKLHQEENIVFNTSKDYTEVKVNIPVSMTVVGVHSKVLGLPQGKTKALTDELTSSMLVGFGDFIYQRPNSIYHYFETLDGIRYKVTRSAFNKEAYFISKIQ